jgi:glutamate:GABA antiporter
MTTDLQTGASGGALAEKPKVFGLFSMVLFSVSAILVADTVASSAAMGVQGLGFWIILGLLFFIPYGFVTAELGSAWPDEGGIYVWVKTAFGPGWGTVTSWMYWVNVALWAPSVFVLFIGAIEVAFGVDVAPVWEAVIVIAMVWAIVLVGILPLSWSKFVPSLSAALKVVVLVGLGALGVAYVVKHGTANSFALSAWVPAWNTDSLSFLPIIIYSYMGFELMSSAGGAIRNPRRDVPRMIILAGAAILAVYMFATFGILASIKAEDVSIVTGIVDALKLSFDEVLGGATWLFNITVVALLFTFFGNMVTWSIGANQTIGATGLDKTAPGVFGHVNRRFGTPDYAFVLMGIIATAITILAYVLDPNQTSVFWTLFALSSIVFLIPYLLMFPALLVLRRTYPDQPRPYTIPGGNAGAWIATILCEAGILLTLFLFFYFPAEGTSKGVFWLITAGGTIVSLLIGWWLYWQASRRSGGVTPETTEARG